ncbi:hypothetical protein UB46_09040 [Burkholderiaceae bacterium 16]|nr:hypothetical protein UB46_09040 [Burkholderiaceae bacterium 16]
MRRTRQGNQPRFQGLPSDRIGSFANSADADTQLPDKFGGLSELRTVRDQQVPYDRQALVSDEFRVLGAFAHCRVAWEQTRAM